MLLLVGGMAMMPLIVPTEAADRAAAGGNGLMA